MAQGVVGLTPRGRQWLTIIEEWEGSGLAMRAFCALRGVNPATLAWWRQELKRRGRESRGTDRVELVEIARGGPSTETAFELVLANGLRVRVPMRFEAAALQALLGVLASC